MTHESIRVFALILFSATMIIVSAEKYYVSSTKGSDQNDGLSEAAPLATLGAALDKISGPGDMVLLKKGDLFRESGKIKTPGAQGNPVVITSYGPDEDKPTICGAETIQGWENTGGNIYRASVSFKPFNLYKGKEIQRFARTPNRGFFIMDDDMPDKIKIKDGTNLNGPADSYIEADAVVRTNDWTFERRRVTAAAAGEITLERATTYKGGAGYGYYLDKAKRFLDIAGEWFYDETESMIYLYTDQNPVEDVYWGVKRETGIEIQWGTGHIRFEGLSFAYQDKRSVYCSNNNPGVEVLACDFYCIRSQPIELHGKNNIVAHCTVTDGLNNGIQAGGEGSVVEFCTVRRLGLIGGYGDAWGSQGIIIGGHGTVRRCIVDSIGYLGITMGSFTTIEENIVRNTALTLNDGGGIAIPFHKTDIVARRNFISGAYGNLEGIPKDNIIRANGFYFGGNNNKNILVENNTIYDNRNNGIIGIDTYDSRIADNVVYNNSGELVFFDMIDNSSGNNDNEVTNNIFYTLHEDRDVVFALFEKATSWADFTGNYYCNPYSNAVIRESASGGRIFSVQTWMEAGDAQARGCPYTGLPFTIKDTLSENMIINGEFNNGSTSWKSLSNGASIEAAAHSVLGPSLALTFTKGYNGFAAQEGLSIHKDNYYLLTFTVAAGEPWQSTVSIDDGAWNNAFESVFVTRREKETISRIFKPTASLENARLKFELRGENKVMYIDNVNLYRVAAVREDPKKRSVLLLNPTPRDSVVTLNGTYIDIDGNPVGSAVTLNPWSSQIVISSDALSVPSASSAPQSAIKLPFRVGRNAITFDKSAKGPRILGLYDLGGRRVRQWIVDGAGRQRLDIADIGAGVYLFRAHDVNNASWSGTKIIRR